MTDELTGDILDELDGVLSDLDHLEEVVSLELAGMIRGCKRTLTAVAQRLVDAEKRGTISIEQL